MKSPGYNLALLTGAPFSCLFARRMRIDAGTCPTPAGCPPGDGEENRPRGRRRSGFWTVSWLSKCLLNSLALPHCGAPFLLGLAVPGSCACGASCWVRSLWSLTFGFVAEEMVEKISALRRSVRTLLCMQILPVRMQVLQCSTDIRILRLEEGDVPACRCSSRTRIPRAWQR